MISHNHCKIESTEQRKDGEPMRNKELPTLVEIDLRMNQLRNILLTLTDDEKTSFLEVLRQLDKKSVDYLINEKQVNPYSYEMLEQLEMLLKKQANLNLERQEETQATLDDEIETQGINRQREEKKNGHVIWK